jgi:hypothetical protein
MYIGTPLLKGEILLEKSKSRIHMNDQGYFTCLLSDDKYELS